MLVMLVLRTGLAPGTGGFTLEKKTPSAVISDS